MDGPWADYAVPQDAAPPPVQPQPGPSPGVEVDIDKGYTTLPDGSLKTLEPPSAPDPASDGPWSGYANSIVTQPTVPSATPGTDDFGLGLYTHAMKPFDRLAEGAEWLAGKLGVNTSAVNQFFGTPSAVQAAAGHQAWEDQQVAQGKRPSMWGNIAGDALGAAPFAFEGPAVGGALVGATQGDGKDIPSILADMGIGAVGGKVAGAAIGKVADAIAPKLDPVVQNLLNRGLKLTPEQIVEGKGLTGWTSRASGMFPVSGELKRAAENQSLASFPAAAGNEVLAPIGGSVPKGAAPGFDLNDAVRQQASGAYKAVEAAPDVGLGDDDDYVSAMQGIRAKVDTLPDDLQRRFGAMLKREVGSRMDPNTGQMTARGILDAKSGLNDEIASLADAKTWERDYRDALSSTKDTLLGALGRSSPEAQAGLSRADATWARYKVFEDAAQKGVGAVNSPEGGFTPTHFLQAIRSASPDAQVATGTAPMMQFAKDAQSVLPRNFQQSVNWTHAVPEALVAGGVTSSDLLGGHHALALAAPAVVGSALHIAPGLTRAAMTARPAWAQELAHLLSLTKGPAGQAGGLLGVGKLDDTKRPQDGS